MFNLEIDQNFTEEFISGLFVASVVVHVAVSDHKGLR